jgi:CHAD domain-containing protein
MIRSGRARKVLRKADRLLDQALADGSDAELHEARKAYKQARYAVEVFEDAGGKRAKKLFKALTNLQDVLGAHQDSVVAREILEELAGSSSSTASRTESCTRTRRRSDGTRSATCRW